MTNETILHNTTRCVDELGCLKRSLEWEVFAMELPVNPGNQPVTDVVPDALKNASALDAEAIESAREHRLLVEWDKILRCVFARCNAFIFQSARVPSLSNW